MRNWTAVGLFLAVLPAQGAEELFVSESGRPGLVRRGDLRGRLARIAGESPELSRSVTWAPDGDALAVQTTGGITSGGTGFFHVHDLHSRANYSVKAEGVDEGIFAQAWSPDGRWLAWVGHRFDFGPWRLGVLSRQDGQTRLLLKAEDFADSNHDPLDVSLEHTLWLPPSEGLVVSVAPAVDDYGRPIEPIETWVVGLDGARRRVSVLPAEARFLLGRSIEGGRLVVGNLEEPSGFWVQSLDLQTGALCRLRPGSIVGGSGKLAVVDAHPDDPRQLRERRRDLVMVDLETGDEKPYSRDFRSDWFGSGRVGELVARRLKPDRCFIDWVEAGTSQVVPVAEWRWHWAGIPWAASSDHRFLWWWAEGATERWGSAVTVLDLATRRRECFYVDYPQSIVWAPSRSRLALVTGSGVFVLDYDACISG